MKRLPSVYNIKASVKIAEKVKKVYLAPSGEEIPYVQEEGCVLITVPRVECHQAVVIDYNKGET